MDNTHVLLPRLVMHAGVIITKYSDGQKTAYQGMKAKNPSNNMLPFGEKVVCMMPKENHREEQAEVGASVWSISRYRAEDVVICELDSWRYGVGAHSSQAVCRAEVGHSS